MFTVTGRLRDGRQAEVSWFALGTERHRARPKNRRGLVGDEGIIRRAVLDEIERRTFEATPTGPFFLADLDDDRAALVQLTSYFADRYSVDGHPPSLGISPLPKGAIP